MSTERHPTSYLSNLLKGLAIVSAVLLLCFASAALSRGGDAGNLMLIVIAAMVLLLVVRRSWPQIRGSFRKLGADLRQLVHVITSIAYVLSWVIVVFGAASMVLGILSELGDSLENFLTAPIGIKPDHTYYGWGQSWWLYGLSALIFRVVAIGLEKFKEAIKPTGAPALTNIATTPE